MENNSKNFDFISILLIVVISFTTLGFAEKYRLYRLTELAHIVAGFSGLLSLIWAIRVTVKSFKK